MTTLDHYAEINPPCPSVDRTSSDHVAFIPMAAVSEDGRLERQEKRSLAEVANGYTCFERGDVLMAKITPCMENGKAALSNNLITQCGFGSTEFHVLRPRPNVDPRFLFYLIWNERFRSNAAKHMTGSAGQKRVPASYLRRAEVPLIDANDQRRIADILDKADAIRRKRKEAIALTEALLRSTFLEMFGDPVSNPKGFRAEGIGDLLTLKSGEFLPAKNMDTRGPYAVYGGNGINGRHSEYMFEKPVITIGRVGVYCGAVHRTEPKSWVTDNALYVAEFSEELDVVYLEHALRIAQLNQYASQSAQPLISGGRLAPIQLLVPPISLQRQFSDTVKAQATLSESAEKAMVEADQLFRALIADAFSANPEAPEC